MSCDEPRRPFPELMEDPRKDSSAFEAERRVVQRQVESLLARQQDPDSWQREVAVLQERRRDVPGAVQFEPVVDGENAVLAETDRFHVRRPELDSARSVLGDLGLVRVVGAARVGGLEIYRSRDDGLRRRNPAELVATARAAGVVISLNHLPPLGRQGIIIKGDGGPERSAEHHTFPVDLVPDGPIVAVIDTGISGGTRSDHYLEGLLDADLGNEDRLDVLPAPDGLLDAAAGHGTFVAGVVQQVAPRARLRVYRAMDTDGIATELEVATVLLRAARDGADVINLSLGAHTLDGEPGLSLLDAVQQIDQNHPEVLIVASAGNTGDELPVWPAAFAGPATALSPHFDNVVSVAGLDADGNPACWSSRGDWVTCSAIGEGVVSTYVVGTEDGLLIGDSDPDTFEDPSWATWTGTSFAAPQVAGAVARLMYEDGLPTPQAAFKALVQGAPQDPRWGSKLEILHGT